MGNVRQNLLPALSEQSALERRIAAKILKINPGLGEKSVAIANSLCDSGLSPSMSTAIVSAVYAPTNIDGRGQGTRARWFMEAVSQRYGNRLDKIRSNISYFRTFVAEMEEMTEFRDTLNGEDYPISFQAAFLLWEVGLSSSEALRILDELVDSSKFKHKSSAARTLIVAAQCVKSGKASSIEGAIMELTNEH